MRTAIILGQKHGEKSMQIVSGPEVSIPAQLAAFKAFRRVSVHDTYSRVELWNPGDGRTKRHDMVKPAPKPKEAKSK